MDNASTVKPWFHWERNILANLSVTEGGTSEEEEYGLLERSSSSKPIEVINAESDQSFLVIFALLSLLYPIGIALLRAGTSQRKHAVHALAKPFVHITVGSLTFWLLGHALSHQDDENDNGIMGTSNFVWHETIDAPTFFRLMTAICCTTIASCGGQEFTNLSTELFLAVMICSVLFPLPVHWCWNSNGWLVFQGYRDYGGSGVIHLIGGTCALALAFVSHPRPGRFPMLGTKNTVWSRRRRSANPLTMSSVWYLHECQRELRSGHNVGMAATGSLLALLGALCLQAGAGGGHDPPEPNLNLTQLLMNSLMAMTGGGLTAGLISKMVTKQWSLYRIQGGCIAGLTFVSSATDFVPTWAALLMGVASGAIYVAARNLLLKMSTDDPVDVISTHCANGFLGLCITPLVKITSGEVKVWYDLAWNVAGAVTLAAWAGIVSIVTFGLLAKINCLGKIDSSTEDQAMREAVAASTGGQQGVPCVNCNCATNKEGINNELPQFLTCNLRKDASTGSNVEQDNLVPRLVLEAPSQAADNHMEDSRRPSPAYNVTSPRLISTTSTMPTVPLGFSQPDTDETRRGSRFMTIQRNKSLSLANIGPLVSNTRGEENYDEVPMRKFNKTINTEDDNNAQVVKSEIVPIQIDGYRRRRESQQQKEEQQRKRSQMRPPITLVDDDSNNNNSIGSDLDALYSTPRTITQEVLNQHMRILRPKSHRDSQQHHNEAAKV